MVGGEVVQAEAASGLGYLLAAPWGRRAGGFLPNRQTHTDTNTTWEEATGRPRSGLPASTTIA